MKIKAILFLSVILTVAFMACNKASPGGFWKGFRKDLQVEDVSDQGPFGGHRAICWRSNQKNAFTSKGVLHFAKINGWRLVDSAIFSENQTSHWMYNGQAVFPLTSAGFSDTIVNNSQLKCFPRWFDGQLSVYKFKSGWISIEPGNANSNDVNGFVVIKNDGGEMAVYHLWGE